MTVPTVCGSSGCHERMSEVLFGVTEGEVRRIVTWQVSSALPDSLQEYTSSIKNNKSQGILRPAGMGRPEARRVCWDPSQHSSRPLDSSARHGGRKKSRNASESEGFHFVDRIPVSRSPKAAAGSEEMVTPRRRNWELARGYSHSGSRQSASMSSILTGRWTLPRSTLLFPAYRGAGCHSELAMPRTNSSNIRKNRNPAR
jgi:hypothetical protein